MAGNKTRQLITDTINVIVKTIIRTINRLVNRAGLTAVYASLWVLTMLLGVYGFNKYFQLRGLGSPWGEILYQTFQLFVLKSGNFDWSQVPFVWQLEMARWLALLFATSVTAGVLILMGLFSNQIQSLVLWTTRDHIVICGAGYIGSKLIKKFSEGDNRNDSKRGKYTVVVIEQNKQNKLLESFRHSGISIILGNAKDKKVLRNAGIERAKYLIVALGDDNANAEVIIQAQRLVETRKGEPLLCFAGINDPTLCDFIKVKEFDYGYQKNFKLEFFNLYEKGASNIFETCPNLSLFGNCNVNEHMLLIGLGNMGESFAIRAAKNCRNNIETTGKKLNITVVDKEATDKIKLMCMRHPILKSYCNIVGENCDVHSPDFLDTKFRNLVSGEKPITAIFICAMNDSDGLSMAFLLHQLLDGKNIPIIVRLNNGEGLSALLNEQNKSGMFKNIYSFDLWDSTCNLSITDGIHETIAQAIHEEYFEEQLKKGVERYSKPAMRPWKELSEDIKISNLNLSYQLMDKMEATLCYISRLTDWKAPLTDWEAPDFPFNPCEIIRLSILEHERWRNERIKNRWTHNERRDDKKKQHNSLVPWAELSAEDKIKDFDTVIKLPLVLYKADLKICRIDVIRLIAQEFFQYNPKSDKIAEKTWWKASEEDKNKYLNKAENVKKALEDCRFGITGYVESKEPLLKGTQKDDLTAVLNKYRDFASSKDELKELTNDVEVLTKIFLNSKFVIYKMEDYKNDLNLLQSYQSSEIK